MIWISQLVLYMKEPGRSQIFIGLLEYRTEQTEQAENRESDSVTQRDLCENEWLHLKYLLHMKL